MGSSYLYTKKMPVNAYGLDHDVVGTPCAGMNDITEEMGERKMFKIFDKKCKEYGLEEKNIFIGSKSISPIEYSTKQEVSFNLSERKNYKTYEYAVKWISSSKNISDQATDDDIYIVWPLKESKCRALTLSTP